MGMPAPDFSMLVIAALASVAAGLAYAVIARERPGFFAAKVLSSLSAIGFGSLGVIWGSTSSAYPLSARIVTASVLAAIVAGALTWVFADINSQSSGPTGTPVPPPKHGVNDTSEQESPPATPILHPLGHHSHFGSINRIGNVENNSGVVSQGQNGDNSR